MTTYQPGPAAADASVRKDGSRYTLVFARELKHPPSKVWEALTDPEQLREWAPFDANRDLGKTGTATLSLVGVEKEADFESEILRADPPRLLEYTWSGDIVRWELEPTAAGTRLTLLHTVEGSEWLPKVAAGWHMCLDVAERALSGSPIGRIVAMDAKRHGWERLNAEYAERFGVENTGWPEEAIGGAR